jgi:hypothetical protein
MQRVCVELFPASSGVNDEQTDRGKENMKPEMQPKKIVFPICPELGAKQPSRAYFNSAPCNVAAIMTAPALLGWMRSGNKSGRPLNGV